MNQRFHGFNLAVLLLLLLTILASPVCAQPRYIFYLIGDGMGINQVTAAEMYRAELEGRIGRVPLVFTTFPYSGLAANFSHSNSITDSSAAGTCLATGQKTKNGCLGLDPEGKSVRTIAEQLHEAGWNIGVMTSVAIDHATPAAFYAHVAKRSDYYTIGKQLAASGFEFFGGAGFHKPENKAEWKAPNLYDLCEQRGYTLVHGVEEASQTMAAEKMILLQPQDGIDRTRSCESLPYAIDRQQGELSLADVTKTAIRYLSAKDQPFFMMVEGGKIDYAGHANDGATNIRETIDFGEAIEVVMAFYREHKDETLIIVTADHETGGMALANSDYTLNLQILQHQHCSSAKLGEQIRSLHKAYGKKLKWEQVCALLTENLDFYTEVSISKEEDAALQNAYKKVVSGKQKTVRTLYQDIDMLTDMAIGMLNDRAKLGWTTHGHSASPVPVFAIGVGAEQFTGFRDMGEIAPAILQTVGR